ncbi:MAG: TonB-dependent receptor [Acidobacteriota bacterium]
MASRDTGDRAVSTAFFNPPRRSRRFATLTLWCVLAGLVAAVAGAQPRSGLRGTVTNADGSSLERVHIVIESTSATFETHSDAKGRFSFPALDPGTYRLKAHVDGYSGADSPLTVRFGRLTQVRVQLAEAVEEVLVVATEPATAAPDPTPSVHSQVERVAADRDPFTAASAPGVRAEERSAGSTALVTLGSRGDSTYTIDGLESDTAPGAVAPSGRLEVVRTGADALTSSSGVVINLTTPEGGPRHRADIEASASESSWLGPRRVDDIDLGDGGLDPTAPSRVDSTRSWGFDAGASLFDDRLWVWGAYLRRELRGQAAGGLEQTGDLDYGAVRLTGSLTPSTQLNLGGHRSERRHTGVGAAPDRDAGATQVDFSPSTWLKLEGSHQFDARTLLTLQAGHTDDAVSLVPLGGDEIELGADGIWRGGWLERQESVDADHLRLDIARAYTAGRGDHELRLGASRRAAESRRLESWGDAGLLLLAGENYGTPYDLIRLRRPANLDLERDLDAAWFQDRITFAGTSDWTLELGLRYERQAGLALGGDAESHPLFPELLPGVASAAEQSVEFADLLPRFGAAWTPGGAWSPTVRFGWSRFAGRLHDDLLERVSPLSGAEVLLGFTDVNADRRFGAGEPFVVLDRQGFDRFDRTAAGEAPAPDLESELTDEWRLGFEARPAAAWELRLDFVRREISRVFDARRLLRDADGTVRVAQVADYRFDALYSGLLPDGTPYAVPVYTLADGLELTGASLIQNGQRRQIYDEVTFGFSRRLSRGFMVRGHATWSDWSWRISNLFTAFDDPTNTALGDVDGVDDDGAVVAGRGSDDRWANSRWSFDVLALAQIAPNSQWGFDLSAHVHGREGYPIPYSLSVLAGDRLREVQATPDVDSYRLEDVITLDLRLEKTFSFGASEATVALDFLNVLDEGYVLERESRLSSPLAGSARATLSPRTVQIGARWSWR